MNAILQQVKIIPMAEAYIASFHACLDSVARERRYLAFLEAPTLAAVREFATANFIYGNSLQFIAVTEEVVVGWCDILVNMLPGFTHIGKLGMGIKHDLRGMGLGKKLMTMSLNKAREKKLERVELEVYASNKTAIKLYERAGFVVEGVKEKSRKLDGIYEDTLCMALLF